VPVIHWECEIDKNNINVLEGYTHTSKSRRSVFDMEGREERMMRGCYGREEPSRGCTDPGSDFSVGVLSFFLLSSSLTDILGPLSSEFKSRH
jgi:hypothetical protein